MITVHSERPVERKELADDEHKENAPTHISVSQDKMPMPTLTVNVGAAAALSMSICSLAGGYESTKDPEFCSRFVDEKVGYRSPTNSGMVRDTDVVECRRKGLTNYHTSQAMPEKPFSGYYPLTAQQRIFPPAPQPQSMPLIPWDVIVYACANACACCVRYHNGRCCATCARCNQDVSRGSWLERR